MKAKLQAILAAAKQWAKDVWNKYSLYFIGAALLALFLEYRDLIISVLVNSGKRIENNAAAQDAVLAKKENAENVQADALVQDAQNAPTQEKPVNDNWNHEDGNS